MDNVILVILDYVSILLVVTTILSLITSRYYLFVMLLFIRDGIEFPDFIYA
jgi:hypothetical protein